MGDAIKPVGWGELLSRRQANDERLIQEYAQGEGRGRDLRALRDWVQHVRADIGARGVITAVGVNDEKGEVFALFYVEPEPPQQPGTTARPGLGSRSLADLSRSSVVGRVPEVPGHAEDAAASPGRRAGSECGDVTFARGQD